MTDTAGTEQPSAVGLDVLASLREIDNRMTIMAREMDLGQVIAGIKHVRRIERGFSTMLVELEAEEAVADPSLTRAERRRLKRQLRKDGKSPASGQPASVEQADGRVASVNGRKSMRVQGEKGRRQLRLRLMGVGRLS